jgi:hypothetical protein
METTGLILSIVAVSISFLTLLFTYFKLVNELSQRLTRVETKLEMIEKKLSNDYGDRIQVLETKFDILVRTLQECIIKEGTSSVAKEILQRLGGSETERG